MGERRERERDTEYRLITSVAASGSLSITHASLTFQSQRQQERIVSLDRHKGELYLSE